MEESTDLSKETAPVDHEELMRKVRHALANPPDMTELRAQLGLTDRPRRRVR